MERRTLGRTDRVISSFCLGTWEIGGAYWGPVDAGEAVALLRRALDLGVTAFDLSDVYGNGRSEVIAGAAFQGRRDEVVLITKAGYLPGIDGAQKLFERQLQCFEMEYLTWACEMREPISSSSPPVGSPHFMSPTCSVSFDTKLSYTRGPAITRVAAVQSWPLFQ